MSIGYACINIGSDTTKLSTLRLNNATEENLRHIIIKNLNALESIVKYNIQNNIKLFRISSDIIPLGSHPINKIKWCEDYKEKLMTIGTLIKEYEMRVSMHPGQYTVLNSINTEVVKKSILDLEYHSTFLDSLGCDGSNKIILHIGGLYSDKEASINRFINIYNGLSNTIKSRLVIENDDKIFNIEDVLLISEEIDIPVVFDTFHHELNRIGEESSLYRWIRVCSDTWKEKDGSQKIHYSQKNINGIRGSHSPYISANEFLDFYNDLYSKDIDIMLEVKDKNLSALKCSLITSKNIKIQQIEREWAKYKYLVLSKSPNIYSSVRNILKDKQNPDAILFYKNIEKSLAMKEDKGAQINAAEHIWGYVNEGAMGKDKKRYIRLLEGYKKGINKSKAIKNHLFKLAKEQDIKYLIDSLYFYLD